MLRFLRYAIEIIAAFVAVTIVLALLLAWRLSSRPISSDFMTPYMEAGIEGILPDSQVHLGATLLTWSAAERAISMHADDIHIQDENGDDIANVPSFDAKISVIGILFGQFMPKDLIITHPQIKLVHDKEGAFVFGGMAVSKKEAASASPAPENSQDTMGKVLRNASSHLLHATLMHKLSVTQAVFDVHDEATQSDWSISIPEISIIRNHLIDVEHPTDSGGLQGQIMLDVTQKDSVASVKINYDYDALKREHVLSTVFADVTPAFFAGGHPETLGLGAASMVDLPLSGKIKMVFDKDFAVNAVTADVHGDAGHLVYPAFWDKPCAVASLDSAIDYDGIAKTLRVDNTSIDFGGPVLSLDVDGTPAADAKNDMAFKAKLTVENMPMNRYGELWPKPILPDPRYWLDANLRNGMFTHSEVSLKGELAWNDLANVNITDGGGKMSAVGGTVTYLDGLPPVENVSATATFDLKSMDVAIASGGIGNIKISPFTMHITGLADPDQDIDIPLQVSGPVPEVLRLLDHQPLGYAKKLGVAPEDLSGQIAGLVDFKFPLLKTIQMKDLDIHAKAETTGVASAKLVPGITIDQGNLAMTLDMNGFAFAGQTSLDKVPFQITWQEYFEPKADRPFSHMTINGSVRDDQWGNFGFTGFNGSKGSMNVALDITRPNKTKTLFAGSLDMTPASLAFPMLNWKKPANTPAVLKFAANQTGDMPMNVTSLSVHGAQINASGDAILSPDMKNILALNLSPLVVGRTNATLHFTQAFGDNGAVSLSASGVSLDVAGLGKDEAARTDMRPKDFTIQVDKLYTSDDGELDKTQITASRDKQGWKFISLHGLADGDTPLSIDLKPQADGHRTFAVLCDNFGKMMKSLGFTDTIKGGKLSILGASTVDNPYLIAGQTKITDFSITKLPVLALLLNATSPFGFMGILTDSTDFSRFDDNFTWQGDEVTLVKAHGAGSAVGINIDGKVNINSGAANLQGTLVPFSVVNGVLNSIPLLGDLITGGKDQGVLAVSYTITGSLNKPDISVNPVSLLTPGFIRNLFFQDDATTDPLPAAEPTPPTPSTPTPAPTPSENEK